MEKIEFDIIDQALSELSFELCPEDASEDQMDECLDRIFTAIVDLSLTEDIPEMPDVDEDEAVKKDWLEKSIPRIRVVISGDQSSS